MNMNMNMNMGMWMLPGIKMWYIDTLVHQV